MAHLLGAVLEDVTHLRCTREDGGLDETGQAGLVGVGVRLEISGELR